MVRFKINNVAEILSVGEHPITTRKLNLDRIDVLIYLFL